MSTKASERKQAGRCGASAQFTRVGLHISLGEHLQSPSASDGPTYVVGASALDDLRRQRSVEHCLVLRKGLISEFPFQLE